MIYTKTNIMEMYEMQEWVTKRGWNVTVNPIHTYLDSLTLAQWDFTPRQELIFRLVFTQAVDDAVKLNISKAEEDLWSIVRQHGF